MRRGIRICGLAALALALAASAASAQTAEPHHPKHAAKQKARAAHSVPNLNPNATPDWLTLGAGSRSGSSTYATDSFDVDSPVAGTFAGMRGREQMIDRYGVGGAPLFNF